MVIFLRKKGTFPHVAYDLGTNIVGVRHCDPPFLHPQGSRLKGYCKNSARKTEIGVEIIVVGVNVLNADFRQPHSA